jgi:hypothetical protein
MDRLQSYIVMLVWEIEQIRNPVQRSDDALEVWTNTCAGCCYSEAVQS